MYRTLNFLWAVAVVCMAPCPRLHAETIRLTLHDVAGAYEPGSNARVVDFDMEERFASIESVIFDLQMELYTTPACGSTCPEPTSFLMRLVDSGESFTAADLHKKTIWKDQHLIDGRSLFLDELIIEESVVESVSPSPFGIIEDGRGRFVIQFASQSMAASVESLSMVVTGTVVPEPSAATTSLVILPILFVARSRRSDTRRVERNGSD